MSNILPADLLQILRCPQDRTPLEMATDALVAQVNEAVGRGGLKNHSGTVVSQAIDGCLVRAAGDILYPIVDGIPLLLHDEAIALDQLAAGRPS